MCSLLRLFVVSQEMLFCIRHGIWTVGVVSLRRIRQTIGLIWTIGVSETNCCRYRSMYRVLGTSGRGPVWPRAGVCCSLEAGSGTVFAQWAERPLGRLRLTVFASSLNLCIGSLNRTGRIRSNEKHRLLYFGWDENCAQLRSCGESLATKLITF